ncbi:hypothetical protein R1sor_014087 [Riccia sorocarpa]|uniref:TOG domain-containing protein n=1 Tax=Riccia sorocarpa TaxID=122646 RepID=A0ABD3H8J8_9MARC
MEEAIEQLQAKDTKERMAGVERLQTLLEQSRKGLSATEVGSLVDASLVLLRDNNFRVSQGTLQALASASALAGEHLKPHFNSLLPAIVERLGDGKQPVRDAGRRLLLALMEISSPTIVVERAGNYAWAHKNWRVREEFARTVASAINLFAATELPFQRLLLPSVLHLLEDSNSSVRDAAMLCLEEMFRQGGSQFREELQRHQLRPAQLKDITYRFEKIEPVRPSYEKLATQAPAPNHFSIPSQFAAMEHKSSLPVANNRRSSPKAKPAPSDTSSINGEIDTGEKLVDPVRVYSEKELAKEMEKAGTMLAPENDWSVRITAMQRFEGLVAGGATEYSSFIPLLKQLIPALNVQLSDRRSSIVKQACHLLNMISKELLQDFEPFAEAFIPVLFKLVVITVLVIAESADICIKTMLRNTRVSRVLSRLIECAKHDRNAVLRARCCEYALLVLEQWGDSPEMQRSVELYEDLIKTCVSDAMGEVRSSARTCFRVFCKCWPERSRRLFVSFDPSVQRLLNEEEGGFQKRYASPSVRDRGSHGHQNPLRHSSTVPIAPIVHQSITPSGSGGYSNSSVTSADRNGNAFAGLGALHLTNSYQRKSAELATERTLEVLQASQEQVNAIESMLRGVDMNEKGRSSLREPVGGSYRKIHASSMSQRVGVDPPSARDPPHPASTPASSQSSHRALVSGNSATSLIRTITPSDAAGVGNIAGQLLGSSQSGKGSDALGRDGLHALGRDADFSNLSSASRGIGSQFVGNQYATGNSALRAPLDRHGPHGANGDAGAPKRILRPDYVEKGALEASGIPGFQRPLLRQSTSVRSSGSSRSSMEESAMLPGLSVIGEAQTYMDGLMSLNDALTEGLSVSADWSARVAAFTFLRKLLQQGSKGLQEITQNFGLVMKLFSAHLDDPHHKVAQAALGTLADLVPACRKSFEAYLERILPHVFARLVDSKEFIRQLGNTALEIVGNTYSIDSLLPALLRSLDEQRSPKAKIAVIEFANLSFSKLANGESSGGSGLLKLWLAKLGPLANDRNAKLKEMAINGIISVYSHFDSTTVLNYILGLSIEEQSHLRRALKQYTPRIEVDLMTYLQNRSQRAVRPRGAHDHSDAASSTSESFTAPTGRAYSLLTGNQSSTAYGSGSFNGDGGRKWGVMQPDTVHTGIRMPTSHSAGSESNIPTYRSFESTGNSSEGYSHLNPYSGRTKEVINSSENLANSVVHSGRSKVAAGTDGSEERSAAWVGQVQSRRPAVDTRHEHPSSPLNEAQSAVNSEQRSVSGTSAGSRHLIHLQSEAIVKYDELPPTQKGQRQALPAESNVPNLLHQMTNWGSGKPSKEKQEALHELLKISNRNDVAVWAQYFNQILTVILESLDDPDSAVKELSLSVIYEMLSNQRERLLEATEVLLEKLLNSTRDSDTKVCSAADRCLTTVLTEFDPYRCLTVVVPLLVSEDEKTLVTCISSLTKLVSRLPSEELMEQLPSFLPALFDAFGNQNADVRKTVVFCLVDIYIVLGKAFVPYLGNLSSTQLRLVTIYANRISQARTGAPLESQQL